MMKKINVLIVCLFILSACCKKQLIVGVNISYPELTTPTIAWALAIDKNSSLGVVDTVMKLELNNENNYSYFLHTTNTSNYNYVVETDSVAHSDTISDITYEIKGFNCNMRVKNLEYKHNGVVSDQSNIIIN